MFPDIHGGLDVSSGARLDDKIRALGAPVPWSLQRLPPSQIHAASYVVLGGTQPGSVQIREEVPVQSRVTYL